MPLSALGEWGNGNTDTGPEHVLAIQKYLVLELNNLMNMWEAVIKKLCGANTNSLAFTLKAAVIAIPSLLSTSPHLCDSLQVFFFTRPVWLYKLSLAAQELVTSPDP